MSTEQSQKEQAISIETSHEILRTLATQSIELARLVATNEICPADLLEQLSQSDDEKVKKNVTANPNTNQEILLQLGFHYPQILLANPIFDLLLLENIALFSSMPAATLLVLLYQPNLSESHRQLIWKEKSKLKDAAKLSGVLCHHVEIWNQWRKDNPKLGIYLESDNLSGANLSEANLSEANLRGANLSGVNLSEANLSWANLGWATLSGANLSGANLSEANLSRANLSRATLSEVNLSGANLNWAKLSEVNLSGANLNGANLNGANLSGVVLDKKTIIDDKWRLVAYILNNPMANQNLIRANLNGANLNGANLSRANLREADLRGAILIRANLSEANLSRANLSRANLREADLREANLSKANLSKALLRGG